MKTTEEVVRFLYKTAEILSQKPQKIKALPAILKKYAANNKLPVLTLNKNQYYDEIISKKLPDLQQENESLYKVLRDFAKKNPPIYGNDVGSHVSYDMADHNENLISLIGTFIECWEKIHE